MNTNDDNDSIRVINEEYERVLSNPDNMIMSEDLQGLIDLPMDKPEEPPEEASVDTLMLTVLDDDGLGVSVRGMLSELSCLGSSNYRVAVDTENPRKEFLSVLESRIRREAGPPKACALILGGLYNAELKEALLSKWSVKPTEPHTYRLEIEFRSNDAIL